MGNFWDFTQKQEVRAAKQIKLNMNRRMHEMRERHLVNFALQPQQKQRIISCSALELVALMDQQEFSSVDVLLTFIERTILLGFANHYVMDEMFDSAMQTAKLCDQARQDNPHKRCWKFGDDQKDTFPPFFGVPISIKESILIKDRISYVGLAIPINQAPSSDSNIVILVKAMGFIPFVRSSTTQALLALQTNNNIFGYAKNPWSIDRSCGGSSGGQCGLVASYCSPFGVGSDHLGDSKVACEFTGLFTLKPFNRYCNQGNARTSNYMMGLPFRQEFTPITRAVEDIIVWNQYMCNAGHYELVPKRQRDSYLKINDFQQNVLEDRRALKIGYFTDINKSVKSSESHKRAVAQAIKVLEKQGHNTVEIEIPQAQSLNLYLFRLLWSSSDMELLEDVIGWERPIPQYQRFLTYANWPWFYKRIIASLFLSSRFAEELLSLKPMNAKDYFMSIYEYQKKQKQIYAYLQKQQIDAIVCPGFFMPAYKHGTSSNFTYCATFSTLWSMLQYPVGCLPATTVKAEEQNYRDHHSDNITCMADQNMQHAIGLPIGLQIVSYPGSQQVILRLMKTLDSHFLFTSTHKSPCFDQQLI